MSRTRIVKGNITKIIGGNYKRYSEDDIENIGSKVIQIGQEDGVSYGTNEEPPNFGVEIEEIYWAFGEENERIKDYSKHYVDVNLVVKVKNGKPGDFVKIRIKSEDGDSISDEADTLSLSGIVLEGSEIIFKQPLKNYSIILMNDDGN